MRADNTHSEMSTDATSVFEPFVGGTEDVLVGFDLTPILEHDGEVGVVWVVVNAASCQNQTERVRFHMAHT